jgi:site-specific DNA recombinase
MATTSSAHIYCRVSSSGQEDGYSLDTQERACRDFAAQRGLAVASVAREVWSGGDRHRPELDAALSRLESGDTLLCYALDRLSRSQVDTAILVDRIESAGASLALVTEDFEKSATGTFLRGAKAFAAELEREKIAERTQRGRRARIAAGKPFAGGKAPFGYLWVDDAKTRLMLDPLTAPVVRDIFDMALSGLSLRAIGATLEARGVLSPNGGTTWTATSVRQILTRSSYAGEHVAYRGRYVRRTDRKGYARTDRPADERVVLPDVAPAIVSAAEFAAVADRLATNKATSTRNNRNPEATLLRAGFISCGHCGQSLGVKRPPSTRPGISYRYCCTPRHTRTDCGHQTIAASLIDAPVWQRVAEVLRDPKIIAREVERRRQSGSLDRDVAALDRRIEALADKQGRMARRVAEIEDDDIAAPLIVELKSLAAQKATAQRERDDLARRMADRANEDARVRSLSEWCSRVGANLDTLSYAEKRVALEALGVKVRIYLPGSVDENGQPRPRWEMTMAVSEPTYGAILYSAT